jgi:hypothetical protein
VRHTEGGRVEGGEGREEVKQTEGGRGTEIDGCIDWQTDTNTLR